MARVSLHTGRWSVVESVYIVGKITRCRSAESVCGAIGEAVYDCVGKYLMMATPLGGYRLLLVDCLVVKPGEYIYDCAASRTVQA